MNEFPGNLLACTPKKIDGKLEDEIETTGYGMHAVPGLSVEKLLVGIGLSVIGPLIFAIYWLCKHPGDLQNAAVPAMLVAAFFAVMTLPDVWRREHKHQD